MQKYIIYIVCILFCFIGCGVLRGYDSYIHINEHNRKELIDKKFKEKFTPEMNVFEGQVYYNYYESSTENYVEYNYIQLYSTGQYAYYSAKKPIDILNHQSASYVGYYTFRKNILKLETAAGNFNTVSYRVIWDFEKQGKVLNRRYHMLNATFEPVMNVKADKKKPNW